MKLEAVAQTLLGAVMGVRVFDEKKPWWARAAYGVVAFELLKDSLGTIGQNVSPAEGPALGDDSAGITARKPLTFAHTRVRTIQDRVAKVHQQMIASTKDPKVYGLAREVLGRKAGDDWAVAEKDHRGEVTALFNEVRKRVRYTWDPTDYDAFQTAVRTLELHTGDCDDMTILLGALCRSVGHQVRSRVVQTKGAASWNHIYLIAKVGNAWMPLDASVNKPAGWEVPRELVLKMKDFDVVEGGA